MSRLLAASLLAADFGNLNKDIEFINNSNCDWFHIDIMDGLFVPNFSYGFPVLKCIAAAARKPLDVHLMIVEPERYIERFVKAGADYITVHYEACKDLKGVLDLIHSYGVKAGAVVSPDTPIEVLKDVLPYCELVLIMSVHPGFGGQSFIENSLDKVRKLKDIRSEMGLDFLIEIDGGVGRTNAERIREAGVDILVSGSSIFADPYPSDAINKMK